MLLGARLKTASSPVSIDGIRQAPECVACAAPPLTSDPLEHVSRARSVSSAEYRIRSRSSRNDGPTPGIGADLQDSSTSSTARAPETRSKNGPATPPVDDHPDGVPSEKVSISQSITERGGGSVFDLCLFYLFYRIFDSEFLLSASCFLMPFL